MRGWRTDTDPRLLDALPIQQTSQGTTMIPGLMQKRQLQIIDILKFAARVHPTVENVSRRIDEPTFDTTTRSCSNARVRRRRLCKRWALSPGIG
jgi:hypothetical protein